LSDVQGLKVAFYVEVASDEGEFSTSFATSNVKSVQPLLDQVKKNDDKVDIFLTCKPPTPTESSNEARLAWFLKPRYHFAGMSELYFARAPYRNANKQVTRFVALGNVNKEAPKTKKWLHALKLEPEVDTTVSEPADTTENPYSNVFLSSASKRGRENAGPLSSETVQKLMKEHETRNSNFRYEDTGYTGYKKPRRNKNVIPPRMDCWFCLASPSCERHLVASVGNSVFLSLPKGGVNAHHVQIIPIAHEGCFSELPSDTLDEVVKYKHAIKLLYQEINCIPVFFERNVILGKAAQRHAFLEVIPIPATSMHGAKQVFENESNRVKLSFQEIGGDGTLDGVQRLQQLVGADTSSQYFYFEIPNVVKPSIHRIPDGPLGRLPLQFGRQVACRILGCPNRVHWKECVLPQPEEAELADRFKKDFNPFDIEI